jgi:hypothetical protein
MDEEIKRADLYMDSNGDMIFIDENGQEYLLTPIIETSSYLDVISSRTLH